MAFFKLKEEDPWRMFPLLISSKESLEALIVIMDRCLLAIIQMTPVETISWFEDKKVNGIDS